MFDQHFFLIDCFKKFIPASQLIIEIAVFRIVVNLGETSNKISFLYDYKISEHVKFFSAVVNLKHSFSWELLIDSLISWSSMSLL